MVVMANKLCFCSTPNRIRLLCCINSAQKYCFVFRLSLEGTTTSTILIVFQRYDYTNTNTIFLRSHPSVNNKHEWPEHVQTDLVSRQAVRRLEVLLRCLNPGELLEVLSIRLGALGADSGSTNARNQHPSSSRRRISVRSPSCQYVLLQRL